MKFLLSLALLVPVLLAGQSATPDSITVDTTIYKIADEAPRFPTPCERYDTTAMAKAECAEAFLLDYVYQRALYPARAREEGISGTAVIGFIVERNGLINRPEILRDPGGDLGLAALRTVVGMQREVRFRPAIKDSMPVRFQYILPIRFRLEEPKPYVIAGTDTVYTEPETPIRFTGNDGQLTAYFDDKLDYPAVGEDSCSTGQLDVQILVKPDGLIEVLDIIDYNDLGSAFTGEAIDAVTSSYGNWEPATYGGRKVTSAYDISLTFAPESDGCASVLTDYELALNRMNEGAALLADSTTVSAGLALMDQAVERFPRDGRFRIIRGQARMDLNMLSDACEDLTLARQITLVDWYDSVLPLICSAPKEE